MHYEKDFPNLQSAAIYFQYNKCLAVRFVILVKLFLFSFDHKMLFYIIVEIMWEF
jgi:hypothetical protein